jgi:hypothetical protein
MITIVVGYACLGLLVGMLTGLTSSPITTTVVASIFTLAGGSIAPFIGKPNAERKILGASLSGFAILCLLGVLSGVYLKVNKKLSLTPEAAAADVPYLKKLDLSEIDRINVQYRNGELAPQEAYSRLWDQVQKGQ